MKKYYPLLTREQKELLDKDMSSQIEELKSLLKNKSMFTTKDDWKEVSVVTTNDESEGGGN